MITALLKYFDFEIETINDKDFRTQLDTLSNIESFAENLTSTEMNDGCFLCFIIAHGTFNDFIHFQHIG